MLSRSEELQAVKKLWDNRKKTTPCWEGDTCTVYPVFIAPELDEFHIGSGVEAGAVITGHTRPQAEFSV